MVISSSDNSWNLLPRTSKEEMVVYLLQAKKSKMFSETYKAKEKKVASVFFLSKA